MILALGNRWNSPRCYPPLRDNKGSIYEGGHREPFLVRWPGKIKPGSRSEQIVSITDVFATCAEIIGRSLPKDAAEDSVSFLNCLLGKQVEVARELAGLLQSYLDRGRSTPGPALPLSHKVFLGEVRYMKK